MTYVDWKRLVEERNAWVGHNFPNPSVPNPGESILGCMEELGELTHAHLKQAQSIRGTNEDHVEKAKDAIGDLSVYLMGVMSHYRCFPLERPSIHDLPSPFKSLLRIEVTLGKGAEAELVGSYTHKKSTWAYCVGILVFWMRQYCQARGWDYDHIVQETWDSVKQRDWIKYPDTGLPPKEPPSLFEATHLTDEEKAMGADGK